MAAEKIGLEPIESSNLSAIGYNPTKQILAVQFRSSGQIFHYAGIAPELASDLYGAASRGRFYAQNIRGKFQAERMTGPCASCGFEGWIGERCEDCGTADYTAVPYEKKEAADDEDRDHD